MATHCAARLSRQHRMRRFAELLAVILVIGSLVACAAPIGVKKIGSLQAQQAFSRSYLSTGKLSADAEIFLRRTNQAAVWKKDPAAALAHLHSLIQRPVNVFTAEMRSTYLADLA